jgi:hypothetical protein
VWGQIRKTVFGPVRENCLELRLALLTGRLAQ